MQRATALSRRASERAFKALESLAQECSRDCFGPLLERATGLVQGRHRQHKSDPRLPSALASGARRRPPATGAARRESSATMSLKLRDLIRQVRACKTAAEERAVIAKESAMIRTAIREEQEHYRHRNVAKLLFMHMLGEFAWRVFFLDPADTNIRAVFRPNNDPLLRQRYPTHFGQLECMKLVASPHFPEKRIGYLGMMLLLSEQADVLMLATNSLKNDLNSENRFISGLALCAIGNLATADMSRDLAPEVDKHLSSGKPYLRKKACLAMARCLTKCPDMAEDFVDRIVSLLNDRSHGVLITVVQLMTRVLVVDDEHRASEGDGADDESACRTAFLRLVPTLVKLLRNLLSMGYSPDHDVGGISDPFLQVQILTLLRLLGADDPRASDEMNDVLAQVATNTETAKNAGNAILYECVQTIMAVEGDDGLRVLAVNILGRFLLNRDNNIRYVALNTLARCVADGSRPSDGGMLPVGDDGGEGGSGGNTAASALQRHRTTVVDCLKDPDISIRQRALELIYHLVNPSNVQDLTAELLNYLVLCPREHRSDICTRVLRVVDSYGPDDRWRVDSLVTMLTIAGRECGTDVQSATAAYVGSSGPDVRAYASHRLLKAVRDDDGGQVGLLNVGVWCVGEYGDLLLEPYSYVPAPVASDGDDAVPDPVTVSFMALDPASVVSTVERVVRRHTCPEGVKQRALTCFVKLRERFAGRADEATLDRLTKLVEEHGGSHCLELQLRSVEYGALINATKGVSVRLPAADGAGGEEEDIFGVTSGGGGAGGTTPVGPEVVKAAREALARMPTVDVKLMQKRREERSGMMTRIPSDAGGGRGGRHLRRVVGARGGGAVVGRGRGEPPRRHLLGAAGRRAERGGPAAKPAAPASSQPSDVDLLSDIFSAPPVAPQPPRRSGAGWAWGRVRSTYSRRSRRPRCPRRIGGVARPVRRRAVHGRPDAGAGPGRAPADPRSVHGRARAGPRPRRGRGHRPRPL
ncbi:hypothetical protein THAOC_03279, partial [Thalassiosira oceanica]